MLKLISFTSAFQTPIPTFYSRLHNLTQHRDAVPKSQRLAYQKYIAEFGTFNANFSDSELKDLHYPTPALVPNQDHSYVRAATNFGNVMLRNLWKSERSSTSPTPAKSLIKPSICWVDSAQALDELCEQRGFGKFPTSKNGVCVLPVTSPKEHMYYNAQRLVLENKDKPHYRNTTFLSLESFNGQSGIVQWNGGKDKAKATLGTLGRRTLPSVLSHTYFESKPTVFFDDKTPQFFADFHQSNGTKSEARKIHTASLQQSQTSTEVSDSTIVQTLKTISDYFAQTPNHHLKLYADYILDYVEKHWLKSFDRTFKNITGPELHQVMSLFLDSAKHNTTAKAIRAVQNIAEIHLLQCDLDPQTPPIDISNIRQAAGDKAQIMQRFLPYGMTGFGESLALGKAVGTHPKKIAITNQNYFENIQNLESSQSDKKRVSRILHLNQVTQTDDIIFGECHPNNVVEAQQFQHDVTGLIDQIKKWNDAKPRTLVLDITLNALADTEITDIVKAAQPLIDAGKLNLIFNQSLTKFSQLGLDKRQGGYLIVINNGEAQWKQANDLLAQKNKDSPAPEQTKAFFGYFMQHPEWVKNYIQQINDNVQTVYNQTVEGMNKLESIHTNRFQLTKSSDPKSCYVASNMRGLLADASSGFSNTWKDIEVFGNDLYKQLMEPICRFLGLPISERMSIGFPLTSINVVLDNFRLTVGLEDQSVLEKYVDVLCYMAGCINRLREPELLFEKVMVGKTATYPKREAFFKEKLALFKALTPGYDEEFTLHVADRDTRSLYEYYSPQQCVSHELHLDRIYHIKNGVVRTPSGDLVNVIVPMRGRGDCRLSNLTVSERRIVMSSLSTISKAINSNNMSKPDQIPTWLCESINRFYGVGYQGMPTYLDQFTKAPPSWLVHEMAAHIELLRDPNNHNDSNRDSFIPSWLLRRIETDVDALQGTIPQLREGQPPWFRHSVNTSTASHHLSLDSNVIYGVWDREQQLGPYPTNQGPATFFCYQKQIKAIVGQQIFDEQTIFVKKGKDTIALSRLPFTERKLLFSELSKDHIGKPYTQFPCKVEGSALIIEPDRHLKTIDKWSIYSRELENNHHVITLENWGVKDPVESRFLRLMVFIYLKETYDYVFKSYNGSFDRFVINMGASDLKRLEEAQIWVAQHERQLLEALKDPSTNSFNQIAFRTQTSGNVSWPSGWCGVDRIDYGGPVQEAVKLMKPPTVVPINPPPTAPNSPAPKCRVSSKHVHRSRHQQRSRQVKVK